MKTRSTLITLVAVTVAAASTASTARAANYVVNDFDGTNNATWTASGGASAVAITAFNGSNALQVTTNAQSGFAQHTQAFFGRSSTVLPALGQGSNLTFDLGVRAAEAPSPANPVRVRLAVSSDAWTSGSGTYRTFDFVNFNTDADSDQTLSVDLAANPTIAAAAANYAAGGGNFFGLVLDNGGFPTPVTAGTIFHFDNVLITNVPEPTALAALGGAAAMLLGRRRRV